MLVELFLQLFLSLTLYYMLGPLGLAISVVMVLSCWSVPYNVRYFKLQLNCKYSDILPFKQMLVFLIKAFVPCFTITHILNKCDCNRYIILILSVCLYILVNHKEIVYIIKRVR